MSDRGDSLGTVGNMVHRAGKGRRDVSVRPLGIAQAEDDEPLPARALMPAEHRRHALADVRAQLQFCPHLSRRLAVDDHPAINVRRHGQRNARRSNAQLLPIT